MDRKQATELAKRLRKVNRALERTLEAWQGLDKASRDTLLDPLAKAFAIVFGKLHYIYERYPELEPPPKPHSSTVN